MTTSSSSTTTVPGRRGWGPRNSEILGPDVLKLPPTLDDMDEEERKGWKTLDEILNDLAPSAWNNGGLLSGLRWQRPLDTRLPPPSPQDHSVYLVTVPRGSTRYRFIHWSLYSQGHFYHLTARGSNAVHYMDAKSGKTSSSELNSRVPVALKVQNVLYPDRPDYHPQTPDTSKTALQAYHIGFTRFNSDQIRQLAASVIGELESYNVFGDNCQLFAVTMAARTVMVQRNGSVFVGHMHQMGAWDSAGGPGREHHYSSATGYVLRDPIEDYTKQVSGIGTWKMSWRGLRLNRKAEAIAILYRKGERAIGAFDPSGQREGFHYSFHRGHQYDSTGPKASEMWEDLRNRRWRDALCGRLEWRKAEYIRQEIKARNGHKMTRWLLPFHRWTLSITEEQRRAWATEASRTAEVVESAETAEGDRNAEGEVEAAAAAAEVATQVER